MTRRSSTLTGGSGVQLAELRAPTVAQPVSKAADPAVKLRRSSNTERT
jgi:hypothetical protein